jgi:hypothetical protein
LPEVGKKEAGWGLFLFLVASIVGAVALPPFVAFLTNKQKKTSKNNPRLRDDAPL